MVSRYISSLLLIALPFLASATLLAPKPLKDRVAHADHVFVGKIVKVRMFDHHGNEKTDEAARTGPGRNTEIRLYIAPDKKAVIKSNLKSLPDEIIVPLWRMWHYSLG